jgi:DNA polymerase-3 subunit alpha
MRTICWPEDYARYGELLVADAIVLLRGVIDKRPGSEEANFVVNEVIPLEAVRQRFTKGIRLWIEGDRDRTAEERLESLARVLARHAGDTPVELVLNLGDDGHVLCESPRLRAAFSLELRQELDELLGPNRTVVVASRPSGGGRPSAAAGRPPGRSSGRPVHSGR